MRKYRINKNNFKNKEYKGITKLKMRIISISKIININMTKMKIYNTNLNKI